MADKKMTRAEAVQFAIDYLADGIDCEILKEDDQVNEVLATLEKMHTQLMKPRKKSNAKSSARVANEPIAREFVKKLATAGEPVNAKWMTYNVRFCTTPQKAVAVAKIAEEWGAIERVSIKNRTFYSLVEGFEVPPEW